MEYEKQDAGCYGDGSLGHSHIREKLAELVRPLDPSLADALAEDSSDDFGEEDEALEILGAHSAPGMVWEFRDGDLILYYDPEQDPECLVYESFPEWALSFLEYGEDDSLTEEEKGTIQAWIQNEFGDKNFTHSTKEGEDSFFSRCPEFGLASLCVTLYVKIMEEK
ncbi:MAG: hypothetical protein M0R06_23435 [Sphaerochaeta sp.]|jgi:hypothetical protein|nr:hypothetical protein [Sphaerochaeta sp.]